MLGCRSWATEEASVSKRLTKSGLLDKVKIEVSGDDFREGLTAVVSVKVAEPQFEGQTKTKLGNSEALGSVDASVGEILQFYLEQSFRKMRICVNKTDT